MVDQAVSCSPIREFLDARGAEWRCVDGIDFVVRVQDVEAEQVVMQSLGICDLSSLRKLGLKGRDSEVCLAAEGIEVPQGVFESCPLPYGGLVVRFGANEFFLEEGIGDATVRALAEQVDSHDGQVFRVEHQEATLLLTGLRAAEVLAQTCAINFDGVASRHVVFTRVAGVSCGILPDAVRGIPTYRIWVEPSYAIYLWETLIEISESLGGSVIGAACLYPELL